MLYDLIKKHYKQEILRQAYMIVGSVDFLGNPIGIVNNVTDGLKAFVSESATGNLFGGSLSLAKHVTHGLADSASKFTGSISAGLGRATMDREYQAARERRKAAVKDSAGHLASAVTSLSRGIVYGVTGVVAQPILGAHTGGVSGFFSGGIKGIVGAVTKPLAGVFDLVSETSAAVRHSAGRGTARDMPPRARLPRVIGPDGTLLTYNKDDARGQYLMRQVTRGSMQNSDALGNICGVYRVFLLRFRCSWNDAVKLKQLWLLLE
eukprot:m.1519536 g.1519536  ORF g.1519536 m.1519536 type:complete len:264 (+) comp25224_c0_seq8:326-1117(+)